MESAAILSLIAVISTSMLGFIWLIKKYITDIGPVLTKLVEVSEINTQATAKLVEMTETNTQATRSADTYIQQRNGRDMKFHQEMMDKIAEIPKRVDVSTEVITNELKRVGDLGEERLEQMKKIDKNQIIKEQHVEHQTIEDITK